MGAIAAASAGVLAPAGPVFAARAFAAPVAYAAAPVAYAVPAGSGLEGQYVPDNLERLYDDGSYKPELNPVELRASPYGLVPAGSGLEGQYVRELNPVPLSPSPYGLVPSGSGLEGAYVPDNTEKLFDDGSYKPEPVYL